ncbi:MAG: hypothetical protein GXP30_02175 [Verrucomicrobia bacterium]|nr:hypothetical protein [Verrucomicrobiota bacterium]
MQRRTFLQSSAALAASSIPLATIAASDTPVIDTNVYIGPNPFHALPLEDPDKLAASLRATGVTSAWAAPMESLLHHDLDIINARHAKTCLKRGNKLFTAIGSINPKLPDWQESLRRCDEIHQMPGIRLHPAYHAYTLDDPEFKKLLYEASKRNLLVQIAPHMEDRRTQNPTVVVQPTDPTPLLKLLPINKLRIQIINGLRTITNKKLQWNLAQLGVHFDISMLESVAGIARCTIPENRLCYGSYAPVFIPESASLKVKESQPDISKERLEALLHGNAEKLLPQ